MNQPELGRKILELRQQQGLTQTELAERCNVSLRTIQRIEAAESPARSYTAKIILEALGYQDKEADGEGRLGRWLSFAKELFNLKKNTMKKLSVLSAILLLAGLSLATTLNAQNKQAKAVAESLVGVWQQVVVNPETGQVIRCTPYLKIFNSDGTYYHMTQATKDHFSFINASGKWKVTSGSTFNEYVELMYEKCLIDHTEQQTFTVENRLDGVFMHSKFHTIGADMADIHETWRKCGFVTREKAREIWKDL